MWKGNSVPGQMVLSYRRKTKEARGTGQWVMFLHSLFSYCYQIPAMVFFHNGLWEVKWNKSFTPQLVWVMMLITAVVNKLSIIKPVPVHRPGKFFLFSLWDEFKHFFLLEFCFVFYFETLLHIIESINFFLSFVICFITFASLEL